MPYAGIQRYADLYSTQAKIDSSQDAIYEDDARSYAHLVTGNDPDTLKPAEAEKMLEETALTSAHLSFLKQTTAQRYDLYGKTLQAR